MGKSYKFRKINSRVITCNICIAIFLLSLLIMMGQQVFAQGEVTEEWVARYNGPTNGWEESHAITLDTSGNIYVTGWSDGGGTGEDYATVSYDSSGNQRWVARYTNGGVARAITIDLSGNVYVTGGDYTTVSYDSSGNQRWVARYTNGGVARAITIDLSGNIYVTGYSYDSGTRRDYITISYDSSGNERWVARYNGPDNLDDRAYAIDTDLFGNIYVTGISYGWWTNWDYATISYDSSGNERWVARYNGLTNGNDEAYAIATDLSGNIYVTGWSIIGTYPADWTTVDYITIAYDSSGNERWVTRYNSLSNNTDYANAIVTDSIGNVYVTGESFGSMTDYDYATVSYDSSGNERWVARYNGTANSYDAARAIAIDSSGNVYITGVSYGNGTDYDYTAISYDSSGNERWVVKYNGPVNGWDETSAVTIDSSGNVYVTGWSDGIETYWDYATIKYSQIPEAPCSSIITSPNEGDIFCAGQEITFTAVTTPVVYEHLIQWSGGGEPTTGTGANFITSFSTHGEKTVTASCGGSSVTKTVTILPETSNCLTVDFSRNIEGPLNAVKSVLKKVPGVKEVDVSISAGVEECDCCYLGTIIEKGEVSGNFGASLTGSGSKTLIGLPPLHIQLSRFGYRVIITGEFGGKLAGEISGNGSGTIKQECNAERCIEVPFEISGSVSAEVKGEAKICAKRPMEQGQCWGVDITPATLSTGVTGQFSLNTCDENLWELCWDGLVYKATIKVRIPFTNIEFDVEKSIPIWDKKCWP